MMCLPVAVHDTSREEFLSKRRTDSNVDEKREESINWKRLRNLAI